MFWLIIHRIHPLHLLFHYVTYLSPHYVTYLSPHYVPISHLLLLANPLPSFKAPLLSALFPWLFPLSSQTLSLLGTASILILHVHVLGVRAL